jgi:DNA transformation protein
MEALEELPNIGAKAAADLRQAGIADADALRRAGSVEAALALSRAGSDVCLSRLSALEGAVRGVRWHTIAKGERDALWREFETRRRT